MVGRTENLDLAATALLARPDDAEASDRRRGRAAVEAVELLRFARRHGCRGGARTGIPAEEILARLEHRARVAVAALRAGSERDELEAALAPREETAAGKHMVYVQLSESLHARLKKAAGPQQMASYVRALVVENLAAL
ncbi:hypothetical protein HY251_21070 [bacterium]|nr:hypothetical protein [bacterium]